MDRCGGYLALLALEENAERYEQLRDVLIAEAEAKRLAKMRGARGQDED